MLCQLPSYLLAVDLEESRQLRVKTVTLLQICNLVRREGTMSTHRARKRIREAKRKARPELVSSDMWVAKDYQHRFDLSYDKVNDTLERINSDEVSEEEFVRR